MGHYSIKKTYHSQMTHTDSFQHTIIGIFKAGAFTKSQAVLAIYNG